MTAMISSYARDAWHTATDEGTTVLDASTGEPVARVSSTGLDVAGMVEHARRVGGPGLRELTFHQRAAALKRLAIHLRERRDDLYEESARTGATTGRRHGRRRRGHRHPVRVLEQGPARAAQRTSSTSTGQPRAAGPGRDVRRPARLQLPARAWRCCINAFNFPVWGMLEKLAPALLAGVPTIVKPATQTSYVTELVVRHIVESGAAPARARSS